MNRERLPSGVYAVGMVAAILMVPTSGSHLDRLPIVGLSAGLFWSNVDSLVGWTRRTVAFVVGCISLPVAFVNNYFRRSPALLAAAAVLALVADPPFRIWSGGTDASMQALSVLARLAALGLVVLIVVGRHMRDEQPSASDGDLGPNPPLVELRNDPRR